MNQLNAVLAPLALSAGEALILGICLGAALVALGCLAWQLAAPLRSRFAVTLHLPVRVTDTKRQRYPVYTSSRDYWGNPVVVRTPRSR
jgi:hypothetical protein